jgi:hypothetical protein
VTDGQPARASTARHIIDASRYLILATADSTGNPWAAPLWYAHEHYTSFLWVSRPEARHSRNLAVRATASVVIFDSTLPERQAQAVYLETVAEELTGAERDHAIAVFSRKSRALGLREWGVADVTIPAAHRLYRASASACYIRGPDDQRLPVKISSNSEE